MSLTTIDMLNGLFTVGAILLSWVIAIIIGARYSKYKRKELLLMAGISVILVSIWWPHCVSFIYAIATGRDEGISPTLYFLLGDVLPPVGLILWLRMFNLLIETTYKKLLTLIGYVYFIVYEVAFFAMLIVDQSLIGRLVPPISVKYNYGLIGLLVPGLLVAFITAIIFCRESLKSTNKVIRLRGKFILLGLLIFLPGALIAGVLSMVVVFLILSRVLIILGGVFMYLGLIMPKFVKRWFNLE